MYNIGPSIDLAGRTTSMFRHVDLHPFQISDSLNIIRLVACAVQASRETARARREIQSNKHVCTIISGTDGYCIPCCICARQTLCFHLQGGSSAAQHSTFLCEISSWPPYWRYDVTSVEWSMRICVKNIPAVFNPDRVWSDGALGFFEEVAPTTTTRRKRWSTTRTRWEW